MNNRRFGVEIECGNHHAHYVEIQNLLRRNRIRGVSSVGSDGSGIEVRTTPLQGKDGFKVLDELMHFLRDQGCYTTNADGMHVHHDTPELRNNFMLQQQLVKSWLDNQTLILPFVAPRRVGSMSCPRWSARTFNDFAAGIDRHSRRNLNINSIHRHGTVEIRLHEGTLDFDRAEAWVKFGQYFISNVLSRKRPLAACADSAVLLRRIRAPKAVGRLVPIVETPRRVNSANVLVARF